MTSSFLRRISSLSHAIYLSSSAPIYVSPCGIIEKPGLLQPLQELVNYLVGSSTYHVSEVALCS